MAEKLALMFRLLGGGFCIAASVVSATKSVDGALWFYCTGIYLLGKADYYELKARIKEG